MNQVLNVLTSPVLYAALGLAAQSFAMVVPAFLQPYLQAASMLNAGLVTLMLHPPGQPQQPKS